MASIYDSIQASSELLYKDFIHKNFQQGWRLCSSGSIPAPPRVPFGQVSDEKPVDENATPPKPKSAVRGGDLQRTRVADSPLDKTVVQVVNKKIGCVHLFVQRGELCLPLVQKDPRTLCGRWKCGTPDTPLSGAEFSSAFESWSDDNTSFGFCERCYGDCYPRDRCLESPLKSKGKQESDDSSSSSSESESRS